MDVVARPRAETWPETAAPCRPRIEGAAKRMQGGKPGRVSISPARLGTLSWSRFGDEAGPGSSANGAVMIRSNVLYLIIGALVVAVGVLGYNLYQDRKEPKGVQINLGEKGLSIQKK